MVRSISRMALAGATVIAGFCRIAAFRKLNRETIPCHRVDLEEIVRGEYAENVLRKDFTTTEKLAIGAALEPLEQKAAKERQREHGKTAPGRKKNTGGKLPQVKDKTRDSVARKLGMSGKTYEKAKAVAPCYLLFLCRAPEVVSL